MKLSTVFTSVAVTVACLIQPSPAQTTIHLRVHSVQAEALPPICYLDCKVEGQYCPRGANSCSVPPTNQCFNPATSYFQTGCDRGFTCDPIARKCVSDKDICYAQCASGQYCPRTSKSCRAPAPGQCFNPATSFFQKGCDAGFKCVQGKCVQA